MMLTNAHCKMYCPAVGVGHCRANALCTSQQLSFVLFAELGVLPRNKIFLLV